jgi:ABC-type transport system involved in multi-copper enzyme maturation permease subunit
VLRLNLLGPIFEKELRATSRRKRTYVLRAAYLGGLLLVMLAAYTSTRSMYRGGGVAFRVQQQNELGQVFFAVFSFFGVISMAAIGPVLTSTAISSERLHKTLPVLLMTPITSFQIVTGKLFSRLLVALTLVGLSLPVLALVRLLGGVDLSQMFGVLVLFAVTAVSTAAVGLFFSTLFNRAFAAILLSYGLLFGIYGFIPLAASAYYSGAPAPGFFRLFAISNPVFNVSMLATRMGGLRFGWSWWEGAAAHGTLAVVLTVVSALLVRRIQRREGSAEATPAAASENDRTLAPARKTPRVKSVWNNPVLWREIGRPLFCDALAVDRGGDPPRRTADRHLRDCRRPPRAGGSRRANRIRHNLQRPDLARRRGPLRDRRRAGARERHVDPAAGHAPFTGTDRARQSAGLVPANALADGADRPALHGVRRRRSHRLGCVVLGPVDRRDVQLGLDRDRRLPVVAAEARDVCSDRERHDRDRALRGRTAGPARARADARPHGQLG